MGLRLFLPPAWVDDADRRQRAHVPSDVVARPKGQMALDELDRVRAAGARFGWVVADAEYGKAAAFRQGLEIRGLRWAVGIVSTQKVYPAAVTVAAAPAKPTGRPRQHPVPSVESQSAADSIAALPETAFRSVSWRQGTKGPLQVDFAAVRVRVADGPARRETVAICRGRRPGWCASGARRGSGSIISPIIPKTPLSRSWPPTSRPAGSANKRINR